MSIILDACFIGQRFEVEVSWKRERLYWKHQNRKKSVEFDVPEHTGLDAAKYLNDYEAVSLI